MAELPRSKDLSKARCLPTQSASTISKLTRAVEPFRLTSKSSILAYPNRGIGGMSTRLSPEVKWGFKCSPSLVSPSKWRKPFYNDDHATAMWYDHTD